MKIPSPDLAGYLVIDRRRLGETGRTAVDRVGAALDDEAGLLQAPLLRAPVDDRRRGCRVAVQSATVTVRGMRVTDLATW